MTINEMIKTYGITAMSDYSKICVRMANLANRDNMIDEIKARKQEIIDAIRAEKNAADERRRERIAKINAIEGLQEIRDAINAQEAYHDAFNRMMEDENNDGAKPPKRPTVSIKELMEKYPRAAAFLKAEDWTLGSHYIKFSAGKTALDRIINGEDHVQVIADMEKTWNDYCAEHIWD